MRSTQVTTWRRYTQAEKKAFQARQQKRRTGRLWGSRDELLTHIARIVGIAPEQLLSAAWSSPRGHHFGDNLGSRVPTAHVNGEIL